MKYQVVVPRPVQKQLDKLKGDEIENVTMASFVCIRSMTEGGWVGV